MKYIKTVFLLFLILYTTNINASSIEYKLKIDKNKHLYETIVYSIENDSQNDYLKSIISSPVFFDKDLTAQYTKTLEKGNKYTIVVLQYDYDSVDIQKDRLLNQCLDEMDFNDDGYEMAFYAIPNTNCLKHADNISIKITTDINIVNSNATKTDGNTQIWQKLNSDSFIDIGIGTLNPNDNLNPPASSEGYEVNNDIHIAPDVKPNDNNELLIISTIAGVSIVLLIIYLIIKKKNKTKTTSQDNFYNY